MSEIFSSLQHLMVDHIRLSLMSQIQNKQNINIPQLILLAIVVGVASWAYDTVNGEGNKFRNISLDIRSYIMRKNSVKIEGKHVIGEKGSINICLNSQKVLIFKNSKIIVKKFKFKKNDIFIKEIKFFLTKIKSKNNISKSLNLFNGIKTLRFAIKLKNNFL